MRALLIIAAACSLGACSQTKMAQNQVLWTDQPAHVKCTSYSGEVLVDATAKGKVAFEEGRVAFVDRATGKYVVTEGECVQSKELYHAE